MNRLSGKLWLTVVFSLALLACDNDKPTGPSPPMTVAEFPMEVGFHWVYHVVDTLSGDEDTVDVLITSVQLDSSGAHIATWQYSSRNDVFQFDSIYVSVLCDSVGYYHSLSQHPHQLLIFPLVAGKTWWYESHLGWDSSLVLDPEIVSTPSGVYTASGINTVTITGGLDGIHESRFRLAKNVGLVRMIFVEGFRRPESVVIWDLLDFSGQGCN
jgi:hypothetical protein